MFLRTGTSRVGLAGIGACVLGLFMSLGALAEFYPYSSGETFNGGAIILFLALFFTGELIGLFGLGILIYLGVSRRLRGRSSED